MDLILRKGDHGSEVQVLQRRLNAQGAALPVDGWYGDSTEQAVAEAQRRAGLVVDGIAGPKTMGVLRGERDTRYLGDADLQMAAEKLGVDVACIRAVNAVESRGSGFIGNGRPAILLERHVAFERAKSAGMPVDRLAAQYPTLISQARGGYAGGVAEWQRFDALRGVTSAAIAIESCSWGLFQIMGYHWQALGYDNAADWQSCMETSEAEQLDAFVRFVQKDDALLKALKARKWSDFAKRYNGPAYAENCYDAKLAAAYAKAKGAA